MYNINNRQHITEDPPGTGRRNFYRVPYFPTTNFSKEKTKSDSPLQNYKKAPPPEKNKKASPAPKFLKKKKMKDKIDKETRVLLIDTLNDYSRWLEKEGYLDTDWYAEEPHTVEEYVKINDLW